MKNKNLKLKLLAASIGALFAGTVSAQAVVTTLLPGVGAPITDGSIVGLTGSLDLGDGGTVVISDYTTYLTSMEPGTFTAADLTTGAGTIITPGAIGIVDAGGGTTSISDGNISAAGSITAATTLNVGGASSLNGIDNNSGGITEAGAISGATDITASGAITGTTITDGTASLNGGTLTGVTSIEAGSIETTGNITAVGINSTGGITNSGGLSSAGDAYINSNSGDGDTVIGNSMNTLNMSGSTVDVTSAGAATISGASAALTLNGTTASMVNSTGHGISVDATSTSVSGGTTSTTLTLDDSGATFDTDGGDTVVSGVADGVADNDAVNVSQLNEVADMFTSQDARIDEVEELASRGIAATAAMANIPQVEKNKTYSLGVGAGSYNGYGAVAVGGSVRMAPNAILKGSVAKGGSGKTTYGVGAAFSW